MKFFRRTLLGGVAGGLYGASGGGGWEGALGGAAGGAAMGGLGVGIGRKMLNNRGGLAGLAGTGLGYGSSGARRMAGKGLDLMLANRGGMAGRVGALSTAGRLMSNYGHRAARLGDTGAQWLGKSANAVNKYGGYALGAIGTASAAHIGSSVLASNRGY